MYTAIVLLPLIGALVAGLFGRVIGARPSEWVTSGLLCVAAVLSWVAFIGVVYGGGGGRVVLFRWIQSGGLDVEWAVWVDTLTAVMLVVVTTVSALVHVYSIGYMAEDPSRPRFFAYLSLFTFAMLALVTSANLVQMFFGWEGVGLASYLLIGFWYERPSANAAAIKAFIVNRIGDFGFALGIFGVFWLFDSVSLDAIFANAPAMQGKTLDFLWFHGDALTIVCLLLFMGAMGKSAQVPLHTWLPDAMEGPTPVSALIHAATMVTAGVFMVARLSPLFAQAPAALAFVTFIGAFTAFFAATVGLVQNDIKRVVAYSTCSQLGYMFVGLGVGAYATGIFHLFTHAFFKALLFLGAGSVIHAMHHEQDMRHMGGLRRYIPVTYWMMVIGTLSLTGFPFTAGYYSKDAIIEAAYASGAPYGLFGFVLTVFAAFLTSFYSWRLIFLVFHGERRWPQAHPGAHAHGEEALHDHAPDHGDVPHESPPVMTIPLAVLAFGALVAGLAFHNGFVGHGAEAFWRESLAPSHVLDAMHHVAWWVSALPTLMMLLGFGLAYLFYIARPELPAELARSQDVLYAFLLNKWYFDEIYDVLFVRPARFIGRVFWRVGDQRIIDGLGPDGIAARVLDITRGVVRIQTGYVYHYAFAMLIGVAILLTWYMFSAGVH